MAWQRVRAAVWCCVILGCGGSGDSPTRQAFDPGMVGNPDQPELPAGGVSARSRACTAMEIAAPPPIS